MRKVPVAQTIQDSCTFSAQIISGINSNLSGAGDHMIELESDIKKILNVEDDNEVLWELHSKR